MAIKLKIKDSWNEISLATFLELKQIDEAPTNDLEKDIAKLSILAGVDRNHFDSYPASEIKKFSHVLDFLDTEPTAEIKQFYSIGGKKYKFISQIKDLTAGQFIDVMNIAKDKSNFNEKLHTLISIFLVPVRKATVWERIRTGKKEIVEKYLESPQEETAENILQNMMVPDVMGLSVFFSQILSGFVNSIPGLFGDQNNDTIEVNFDDVRKGQRFDEDTEGEEDGGESQDSNDFFAFYGWVAAIDAIANNDCLRWEQVTNMPVVEFLNAIVYRRAKAEYDSERQKRNNRE